MQISNNFATPAFRGVSANANSNTFSKYMDDPKIDKFTKSAMEKASQMSDEDCLKQSRGEGDCTAFIYGMAGKHQKHFNIDVPTTASDKNKVKKDYSAYANKEPEFIANKFADAIATVEYNKPLFGFFNRKTTYSKSEMNEVKNAMMADAPTTDAEKVAFAEKCDSVAKIVKAQSNNDSGMSAKTVAKMLQTFDKDGMHGVEAMATAKNSEGKNKYTSKQMEEAINHYTNEQMAMLAEAPGLVKTNMSLANIQHLLVSGADADTLDKLGNKVAAYEAKSNLFFATTNAKDLKFTSVKVTQGADGKPARYDVSMVRDEKAARNPDYKNHKELKLVLDDQFKKRSAYTVHHDKKEGLNDSNRVKYDKNEKVCSGSYSEVSLEFMHEFGENGKGLLVDGFDDFN